MKSRTSLSLSLAIALLFLAGCCCQPSGPVTLTTSDGLAQITVTDGMSQSSIGGNPDTSLEASNIFRELYVVVISESASLPVFADYDLDSYTALLRTSHSEQMTDVTAQPVEPTTINGYPARMWSTTGSAEGVTCYFVIGIIEAGGHYNQVMAWTLADRKDTYDQTLKDIIRSFQLAP